MPRTNLLALAGMVFLVNHWSPSISIAATDAAPKSIKKDGAATPAAETKTQTTPKKASEKKIKDIPEAASKAKSIWTAFKDGRFREAIAGCIVLLIFLWRRFAAKLLIGKLSSWWVGLIAVFLGYLGSIPAALSAEGFSWGTFVWNGLLTSGEAVLFWQMAGKKILPKIFGDGKKPAIAIPPTEEFPKERTPDDDTEVPSGD